MKPGVERPLVRPVARFALVAPSDADGSIMLEKGDPDCSVLISMGVEMERGNFDICCVTL
jgi:hypothetical protein